MNKESNIEQHATHATLVIIALVLGVLLFSGCTSLDKAVKVATRNESNAQHTQTAITAKFKYLTATHCNEVFPVAESEVIPGSERVEERTETDAPVVVPCEDKQGNPVKHVQCPGVTTVYRTVTRTDTIKVRSTAAEYALRAQADRVLHELSAERQAHEVTKKTLAKAESQNRKHWWGWGVLAAIVIGLGAIRFFLPRL